MLRGKLQAAEFFDRCPWGPVHADPDIAGWLTAHGIASRDWGRHFPMPGRPDPQLLEAFVVISVEHDRIDLERMQHSQEKRS